MIYKVDILCYWLLPSSSQPNTHEPRPISEPRAI